MGEFGTLKFSNSKRKNKSDHELGCIITLEKNRVARASWNQTDCDFIPICHIVSIGKA